MNCFNCGAKLNPNSIKCPECGFCPDLEFIRKCPDLIGCNCSIQGAPCRYLGEYQTCPVKNEFEGECGY